MLGAVCGMVNDIAGSISISYLIHLFSRLPTRVQDVARNLLHEKERYHGDHDDHEHVLIHQP